MPPEPASRKRAHAVAAQRFREDAAGRRGYRGRATRDPRNRDVALLTTYTGRGNVGFQAEPKTFSRMGRSLPCIWPPPPAWRRDTPSRRRPPRSSPRRASRGPSCRSMADRADRARALPGPLPGAPSAPCRLSPPLGQAPLAVAPPRAPDAGQPPHTGTQAGPRAIRATTTWPCQPVIRVGDGPASQVAPSGSGQPAILVDWRGHKLENE